MGTSCSGGRGCDRDPAGADCEDMSPRCRQWGLAECTSGDTDKSAYPHPLAASPCPISATAGLVLSSTQPCSAQSQVLLPQGSCQLPFPAQLLSSPSAQLSLASWALTGTHGRGVQQPQASHQQSALLQHTCCCVHSQGTVLTWRKWQLPKHSLKKLQDLESTK